MSRSFKSACGYIVALAVVVAACGGSSDSEGRTRNAVIGGDVPELCIDSDNTSLGADGNLSIALCDWAGWPLFHRACIIHIEIKCLCLKYHYNS